MERREVVRERAAVAARLNRDLRDRKFHDRINSVAPVDDDGDALIMAAGPSESAVVTIHRMERSGAKDVAVATLMDDHVYIVVLKIGPVSDALSTSVPGEMTVLEWFRIIEQAKSGIYQADGADLRDAINSAVLVSM